MPLARRRHRHGIRSPGPRLGEIGVIPLALGLILFPPARAADLPPPIEVEVEGAVRMADPGISLGRFLRRHGVRPEPGDLLDVEGKVLERGAFPGRVLVNGRRVGRATVLEDGDRLTLRPGRDRSEGTERQVVEVTGDMPPNPQSFLGNAPGEQVIVKGRRSGKIVSVAFHPSGPARQPKQVALTFDDGPHPVYTPRILSTLKRLKAKATFFVVGSLADRYPHIVRRQRREGMTIGNHSMHHPFQPPFHRLPREAISTEIRRSTRVLSRLGATPTLFRPPAGSWSAFVLEEAERAGQRLVLWSVDSEDWVGLAADQIARGVLRDARAGSIVLLHDGGGDRSATVAALPDIIKGLRRRGLQPVAL